MQQIKTLILDVGGVLVLTQNVHGRRKWEEKLGLSKNQLSKEVFEMQPGELATVGDVHADDIWKSIQKKFSLSDEQIREMEQDFYAGDVINEALFSLLQSLHGKYKIAMLSNAWGNARKIYTEKYHLDTIADEIIISAEVGVRKPDPKIYLLTMEKLQIQNPSTVLFIDDTKENVTAAETLGMQGIVFLDTNQTIDALNHFIAA